MYGNLILDLKFFGFGKKFAKIGSVLCLSAYSPYKAKHS